MCYTIQKLFERLMFLFLIFFSTLPGLTRAQGWDIQLLKDINLHRNPTQDPFYTRLSASVYPLSIGLPLALTGHAYFCKTSLKTKTGALAVAGTAALTLGLSQALKWTIHRERPYVKFPEIDNAAEVNDPSMPSGHTASAFSMATSLTLIYPKWYIAVPAYFWAGSVGYSRLHLGVHYPTDVVAGAILGVGSALLTDYVVKKWTHKKEAAPRISMP